MKGLSLQKPGIGSVNFPEQGMLCRGTKPVLRWAQIQESSPSCCHVAVMEEWSRGLPGKWSAQCKPGYGSMKGALSARWFPLHHASGK
ncbi:hypothetical protein IHE44_0007526 [Lamprotornis superbus]|uniref:Uncharacterized protein n=1 Tax=Lamprotornis superbus TaxID=245042 RepID=A0A835NYW5_9PASS|nr:hypothetical protein IHE44_0007526 [Lamprotornis superbus]